MKKHLLLFSFLFIGRASSSAQTKNPNEKLTAADRKNYVLNVDSKRIKSYDSVASYPPFSSHSKKMLFLKVPVTLANKSSKELRYLSMSCGWDEIYLTNNENVKLIGIPCDKNVPVVLTLAPYQSKTLWLALFAAQRKIKNDSFSVGMILKKSTNYFDSATETVRKDQQDVIWSNPINIPAH